VAQYDRPPKKKAKGPDEFISFFDRLVRYFLIHRLKFYVVIGAVALGFMGWGVYLYLQSQGVKEFAVLYNQALQAPPQEALQAWNEIGSKNPPLNLDDIIDIQKAGILAREGKWKEAADYYFQAGLSSDGVLRYTAQWAGAVALENAGDYQKAFEEYQKMSSETDNPFKEYGHLGMARCKELMGNKQEAEKILWDLLNLETEIPQAVASAARNKLLVLKLK
jgi:tetratricopeptide (TPR) repeat protein